MNVPLTQRNPMKKNDEETKNRVCHKSMTHPIFYDGGLLLRKPFSILIVFCEILVGEEVGLAG